MSSRNGTEAGPRSVSALLNQLQAGELQTIGMGPIGTGFEPLDSVLDGGFLPGDVILLGGQPGAGKTICALQWARHIATAGRRVTFACFEHDEPALLNRLLIQEVAAVAAEADPADRIRARSVVKDLMLGVIDVQTAVNLSPLVFHALSATSVYSPNLQLLRASSQYTTPYELDAISGEQLENGGVLVVDYLQKLPIHSATDVADRVYQAIEVLKELAIEHQISVLALSAAADRGINASRLRLEDLRGSAALAHECDVAILMNHKATATSERHLKYDLTQLDEARKRTVFSIEKNRRGEVDIHLEFVKDFANFRFQPRGAFMSEALHED
jgi:replicative DNA helicase